MATKQTTTTTTTTTTAQPDTVRAEHRAQWATERARLVALGDIGGTKGAGRFARMATMLIGAETMGEARITFAQANERMGANRLTGPAGAASWRTLLQRFGQLDATAQRWAIDAETGAFVRRPD